MTDQYRIKRRPLALGILATTVLTACGGGGTPNVAPNPSTSTAPSAAGSSTAPSAQPAGSSTAPSSSAAASGSTAPSASAAAAGSPTASGTPAASAAASGPRIPAPANKKDLIIVTGTDITTLDPVISTSGNDPNVHFTIFDNLLYRDASGKLQPMLATEYKSVDDTTWQFKLRDGVKFHNGDPLTSADVKFSIERTYDPNTKGSAVASTFATIASVETPDPMTVVFKTKAPDPLLPARLAFYGGQIVPAKYFQAQGPEGFNKAPIGAGPFKFVEWVKDDRVVLDAHKEYWGGAPNVDRVTFKPRPETAARVSELVSGQADIALNIPPDQIDQINKAGKTRVETTLYAGLYVLAVNSKQPIFAKPEVKQALAYGIDRQTIIDTIWRGQGIVPSGMINKGSFAFDEKLPPLAYDANKVKDLLKQAGYNNEEIVIETTQGYVANDRQMAEAIVQGWKALGINAKAEIIEISVRAQKNKDKSFKGLWWSDPTDTLADPAGMIWRLIGPGGSQDYWRDARWDQLGTEANATLDQEKRKKDYDEMNQIFLKNFPWIPVLQPQQAYGMANYVEWTPYSSTYFNLRKDNLKLVR